MPRSLSRTEMLPTRLAGEEFRTSLAYRPGSSNTDLLMLLHGLGCAKESFSAVFDSPLFEEYAICAFDFPGHGSSSCHDRSLYSVEAYANLTVSIAQDLPYERLFLVGHSMGGAVGLLAAAQLGRSLGCFVSIEGNLVAEDCGIVSRGIAAQSLQEFEQHGYERFLADLKASQESAMPQWAAWFGKATPVAVHQIARSLVHWSDSGKLLPMFANISNRHYIYGAEGDRPEHILSLLRNTATIPIAHSGHFPMLDNPESFCAALSRIVRVTV